MYRMCLVDGTEVEFSGMNGTNYIVPDRKEMDTSIFTDANLETVTVTDDDGNTEEFHNLSFTQQQHQMNGDYYVCFHERTAQEIAEAALKEQATEIQELQLALVELYESTL